MLKQFLIYKRHLRTYIQTELKKIEYPLFYIIPTTETSNKITLKFTKTKRLRKDSNLWPAFHRDKHYTINAKIHFNSIKIAHFI